MRYAIVSDIHANIQAWNAALLDIRSLRADKIICLGDCVGYGPSPSEVLESVHSNVDFLVLGNHDAVVCGKMSPSLFNDTARDMIFWTMEQLNSDATTFLKQLPLCLDAQIFRCAHGDFSKPSAFKYIIDPEEALPSWDAVDHQLLFVGHSHDPCIFVLGKSGAPHIVEPQDFSLENHKRYIVNVGSIGQPRNGDARACYTIFDEECATVTWRKIPFDIDAYRAAIKKAGIPEESSRFLTNDPRLSVQPLREMLSFSQAVTQDDIVTDTVEVQQIGMLKKNLKAWKLASTGVLAVLFLMSSSLGVILWQANTRSLNITGKHVSQVNSISVPHDKNVLRMPDTRPSETSLMNFWIVHLADRRHQSIRQSAFEGYEDALILRSDKKTDELTLTSSDIIIKPGMKFCMEAFTKVLPGADGHVACVIALRKKKNGIIQNVENFIVKESSISRKDGWYQAKKTFVLPAHAYSLRYIIRAKVRGEIAIRSMNLSRKQ